MSSIRTVWSVAFRIICIHFLTGHMICLHNPSDSPCRELPESYAHIMFWWLTTYLCNLSNFLFWKFHSPEGHMTWLHKPSIFPFSEISHDLLMSPITGTNHPFPNLLGPHLIRAAPIPPSAIKIPPPGQVTWSAYISHQLPNTRAPNPWFPTPREHDLNFLGEPPGHPSRPTHEFYVKVSPKNVPTFYVSWVANAIMGYL